VSYKTLALHISNDAPKKDRPLRDIMIPQHSNIKFAWFDGAAQLDGILCRTGGVLKLPDFTVIIWVLNCGIGTNTKANLMGAWETPGLASHMSLQRLQIMGDSKVVIDSLSNRGRLHVCAIEGWKSRIQDLIKSFNLVSFEHNYQELQYGCRYSFKTGSWRTRRKHYLLSSV